MPGELKTRIATFDETSITWRGMDLVHELLGQYSFTEILYFLSTGRMPNATETKVLDLCLVTLMEHGMTPHAIVTRLVRDCNPDQVQIAMSAGLTCVGDVFSGTMDGCGRLLEAGLKEEDRAAYCQRVVAEHRSARKRLPGFGHNLHKPDDPRSPRLFELALAAGVKGDVIALLKTLSEEADSAYGRHVTINATGALAALMLEIGIPVTIMRCIAVVSRAGGLVGHVQEDLETGSGRQIWLDVEEAFEYEPPEAG
ncbi:citryl-CoA lyase [Vannielia litorea]|uniref:citryl-CoA lyase n=1 Tax=Vannielia litorea TaxID=1217970 RepID=UPI001BCDCBCA|nr:citryl-CoA lyase [Vannielia litorea]MBS8224683.1 citryl-CoA lyase [Vannielia litorea]